jgi:hypothetical protein
MMNNECVNNVKRLNHGDYSSFIFHHLASRPHSGLRWGSSFRKGQALIEIFFVILFFFFFGVMAYEAGIMYYNVNQVSNALKQGVWLASIGATDDEIMDVISNVDRSLFRTVFFDHKIENFAIEVWVPTSGGEHNIAPTANDWRLTPGSSRRAAYLWRAHGMNVRMGLTYKAGYVSPYFGTNALTLIEIALVQSQPVLVRNDEDIDGMVDLYEPELHLNQTVVGQTTGYDTYVALSHTDSKARGSDFTGTDIDGDGIADMNEAGLMMYDFNDNGILDPFDPGAGNNLLRHPRIGGRPANWP